MAEALSEVDQAGDRDCHVEPGSIGTTGQRVVVGTAIALDPATPPAKNERTGQLRVDDRVALEGILFVAEHGIAWKKLPTELGVGSGATCWRRLRT